jgi:hypothetical protein
VNDPVIATPNVPVFDFRTGQTVNVTQITGGNANLNSDDRQVSSWAAPDALHDADFSIQSTWTYSQTDDAITTFPTITPDLEAALPGRFTRRRRRLTSIDARPLNFAKTERQDIRTGVNYSRAFGKPRRRPCPAPGGGVRPAAA